MQLTLTTTLLTVLAAVSAIPAPAPQSDFLPSGNRDVRLEVPEPAMTLGGIPVEFSNKAGMGTKAKRQVDVAAAAMSVNGQVVPYQNLGSDAGMGSKKAKRQVDVGSAAMSVNGRVVPYQNLGADAGMGSKVKRDVVISKRQTGVEAAVMSVNGQVVPYQNLGADAGMGS